MAPFAILLSMQLLENYTGSTGYGLKLRIAQVDGAALLLS